MKKALLTGLSIALVAVVAVFGTLAYYTDRGADANVFTWGDVAIQLNEDFTQGAQLIPGVDIEKEVTITNTGKNDAWVWTTIAIPAALDSDDASQNVLHFNYSNESLDNWTWTDDEGKWMVTDETIDGIKYKVYTVLYKSTLAAGATTETSAMHKVYLDTHVDIAPNGDLYKVINGTTTKLNWNVNDNGNPVMYVSAYAIQAEKFDSIAAAWKAYGIQWGNNGTEYAVVVNSADDLARIMTTEGNIYSIAKDAVIEDMPLFSDYTATDSYTVNGNGATVAGVASSADVFTWSNNGTIPAMSNIFSSANGDLVTVNDLTFTGTISSVMAGNYVNTNSNWFNTIFNNVNIIDAKVVCFSAGISPALCVYGTMTLNNCNIYGTTLSTLDTDPMWPVYDVAVVNYSDTVINNSKIGSLYMWNQAKVTVASGTKIDSITVRGNMNANKYGLTVQSGATVGVIDLTNIANVAKVNITIEDGAAVGAIVDDGVEYDTIDAWKAAQ